jgi:hypothetical protein
MHAAKIPFTGMIISSLAVTCILLIAWYIPGRNILKATLIVALFKLLLSPHSPPTAYIAVFFQGYVGHMLLNGRKQFKLRAVLLCTLALAESGAQRLLVLMVLYGNDFWNAVNVYVQKIFNGSDKNYSLIIAIVYIIIHALAGIVVGLMVVKIIKNTQYPTSLDSKYKISKGYEFPTERRGAKKYKIKGIIIIVWLILLLAFIHNLVDRENSILAGHEVLMIFGRSVLILLTWILFIGPFFKKFLHKMLYKYQVKEKKTSDDIMKIIPEILHLLKQSWKLSGGTGVYRLQLFLKILLLNILPVEQK